MEKQIISEENIINYFKAIIDLHKEEILELQDQLNTANEKIRQYEALILNK